MARNGLVSKIATTALAAGALALAGCGGGGSGGGVDRPAPGFQLGTLPTVSKLETPLGLAGSRGSGSNVFVSVNLKDKEFNPADIQVEFGFDVGGGPGGQPDGIIEGSIADPTAFDEYFPCTAVAGLGSGTIGIDTAGGRGADHLFVWDSDALNNVPGARFVTQDYAWTPEGRAILGSTGSPIFANTPGIRLRARANDDSSNPGRWGPWKVTAAFSLNNNNQPRAQIDSGTGLFGVTPNATGTAADEAVVLNFKLFDLDSDPMAVAVDYAQVPELANLADPNVVAALSWFPATTFAGTADLGLVSTPGGAQNSYTWDSAADAGTVNGRFILRVSPFDSKKEHGPTVLMDDGAVVPTPRSFRLDNFTIFTDAGAALTQPRVGHQATTLSNDRVLVTGGRTTAAGASVSTAELFFPGIGSTTYGAVAATASMGAARSFHSQTRLFDDRILVTGGFNAAGGVLNSMEIFDPVAGTWSTVPAVLTTGRARHAAVILQNGDVLLAGGVDGAGTALAGAEVFHPDTNTVTAVPETMAAARHSVAGVLLPDGRALLAGGKNSAGAGISSVAMYDPKDNGGTGGFVSAASMAAARADHSVSLAVNGRVIVTGGTGLSSVEVYDPIANTWTAGAALSTQRAGHLGLLTGEGRVVVAGGHNGTTVVGSAQVYIPTSNTYDTPNGALRTARRDAATAVLNNGRILIVGGTDAAGAALASIEIYTADGGSNFGPTARIATPLEPQSWQFGALLSYRLIDPETNPARTLLQYSISGGPWESCTASGGVVGDAVPDTIAGDLSSGLVSLATTATDSTAPIDPVLKNTAGDHLFVWDMTSDLPQNNYDSVKIRVIPFGAGRGVAATTNTFKIARNTRVIPRFAAFTAPVHGTVRIDYHLQDIDAGGVPGQGDAARAEFEFGVDLNGDRQIITDDGESWKTCTAAAGGDPLGSTGTYPLVTSTTFNPTLGTTGWHLFFWDSIRDVGSPDVGVVRSDVLVRLTPYDFPAADPEETKGRQGVLTSTQGFQLDLDTTGLRLLSWRTQGGVTYSGTQINNVLLDERLVFTFSREVDPASVDGTLGLQSLRILVSGRQVLGTYQANPANFAEVTFFPQLNDVVNGAVKFNGTENPTVSVRGAVASVLIPGFVAGTNPETGAYLRIRNFPVGGAGVDIVNLVTRNHSPAFRNSTAAGTAAYFPNGIAPTYTTSTPGNGGTDQSVNQAITVNFSGQISGEAFSFAAMRFRVDLDGDGVVDANDPVIPGTVNISNTGGAPGTSVITFTPLNGFNYPIGSSILVDFSGLRAGDGTLATGGTAGAIAFGTTATGTTTTTPFVEDFSTTTKRDAVLTTALWNSASFPGILTGLRDGGSGADGTPSPDSTSGTGGSIKTFSSKDTWNFTSMTIPSGERWVFTGGASNNQVNILVTGDVVINGILDVSGGDGEFSFQDFNSTTTAYMMSSSVSRKGGVGNAGGGKGGDSSVPTVTYSANDGTDGTDGKGGTGGAGKKGLKGTSYSVGHGGGGGAGHAQAGTAGGKISTSTSAGAGGTAGSAYGTTDFSGGLTAGSGGGSGGSVNYGGLYNHGGAGGGGGGGVKLTLNGAFTLAGTGIIDASGGEGGSGCYVNYGGSGGGGSGGGVWIKSGGKVTLFGIIDVQGGVGGENTYYKGSYLQSGRYGCFGGPGASGRIRVEGPNLGTTTTQIIAGMHLNTIAAGTLNGGTGALGSFPTTATVNIDAISKDASGFMNFTTMNIPTGTTVTLTGTSAAKMRFTGGVTINGVLRSTGNTGPSGVYASSSFAVLTAATGGVGGGAGGIPNTSSSPGTSFPTNLTDGGPGGGNAGGLGGKKPGGQVNNFTTWGYAYYWFGSGGGGGSNLANNPGTPGYQTRYGRFAYNTGAGGLPGTSSVNPANLAMTGLAGGSGGGAGANMQYFYFSGSYNYSYSYGAGGGGGGGGGIGIETTSAFTLNGKIESMGGAGGISYSLYYGGGGGGGGSGGTVLVRASTISFATTNATVDTRGGLGAKGGYSQQVTYQQYTNGGIGGLGAARFEAVTAPSDFLNLGGMQGLATGIGSLTTAFYATGDKGVTTWQTAAGLAPDFSNSSITALGNMQVRLEGAHANPVTGLMDLTNTGFQDIKATALTSGITTPDAADGFKYFRLFVQLQGATAGNPFLPELDSAAFDVTTK